METTSLTAIARNSIDAAKASTSGRSATTVFGGHENTLRQTLIALAAGHKLDDHSNPGEATVHVLVGSVRLISGDTTWAGNPGDLLVVPQAIHSLEADVDSAVLLSVAKL